MAVVVIVVAVAAEVGSHHPQTWHALAPVTHQFSSPPLAAIPLTFRNCLRADATKRVNLLKTTSAHVTTRGMG